MKNKKQLPAFLVLTIICLIAALALAATNAVTKGPIEEHAAAARAANFSSVLSATAYEEVERDANDGVVLVEAWRKGTVVDALSGATVTSEAVIEAVNAAVKAEDLTASAKGFQSDVTVAVTLDDKGLISGLTIDSASETPNFGTRCASDEAFIAQFVGKAAPFVRTEGLVGYCVSASETGYAGAVAVTLGVNLDGEIVGAKIGDNNFRETGTIGGKWLAEDKVEQFIGIDLVNGGAIDTIAGATITSDAVKGAANKGADALRVHLNIESDAPVFGEPKPVEYADSVAAGDYNVAGAGFQSNVKVSFTVDENSTITALTMDTSGETQGYGTRCGEDEGFVSQFIGKAVPVTEFDALSGATITSNAVVTAINSIAVAGAEEPSVEASADVPAVEDVPADGLTGTARGFQSDVVVTLTVDENGAIASIKVDSASETPNFGTRCGEDEAFLAQFIGKTAPVAVDVLAGATVTSNAVMEAVNAALPAAAPAAEELTGTARGFQSDVVVTLTVDENGAIASIKVDSASETPNFGTRCGEDEAFLAQFIGKTAPVAVDVLAGATVTSNAVIDAVNSVLPTQDMSVTGEELPIAEVPGNELTGTAHGFQSDVVVTLTVDENGAIASIKVDSASETPNFGTRCGEDEAFLAQFIGKTAPVAVDVLAGATVTSNAVIDAVNSVLPTQDMSVTGEELPIAEVPGNELTGTAHGFQSDVVVTLTVADGVITAIKVDAAGETPNFGTRCGEDEAFLNQYIGKKATPDVGEGIEALSGATVTSNAVLEAVNAAIGVEVAEVEIPAAEELTGTAHGFQSDVVVTLTVDETGAIASIKVDSASETPNFGTRCGEDEAFLNQYIGKKATPDVGEGIEALSGATVTSNAVLEAVNAAIGVEVAEVEIPAAEELTGTAHGFQSDVVVTLTVDENGAIASIKVDSASETPNFGTRCGEDEAFLAQFIGKTAPVAVDVLAGATVTSNAVMEAVNAALPAAAPAAEELTGTARGFQSDVVVTLTVDETGAISSIKVDSASETPNFGTRCGEDEAFLAQFIGKTAPVAVDVLAGATVTSNAVMEAVNAALPAAAPAAEELTGTARGFQSDVVVTLTVDENGAIASIKVDSASETPNFGTRCGEDEAFLAQFIGKTAPVAVDVLAGATVTSNAVIDAVNSVLAK